MLASTNCCESCEISSHFFLSEPVSPHLYYQLPTFRLSYLNVVSVSLLYVVSCHVCLVTNCSCVRWFLCSCI